MSAPAVCKWCADPLADHSPKGCAVCPCMAWSPERPPPLTGAQLAAKLGFKPLSHDAHRANVSREARTVVAPLAEASETPCARCGKAFPWFATPEEALESIACCDACHERVTFEVDEEAREQVTTLRAQLAEARAETMRLRNIVSAHAGCPWPRREDCSVCRVALSATGDEGEK